MRKFLALSVIVFFAVISIEVIGLDWALEDHTYYAITGQLGDGHDLTLLVLRPMYLLLPSPLNNAALPIFINFMFVLSVYFMLKPFVKCPEWAFILAPITPLGVVYAQIFAISLFNFMLGFYFRRRKGVVQKSPKTVQVYKKGQKSYIKKCYTVALPPLFLILVFLAHYWTGLFVAGVFALYLFLADRPDKTSLFSTIIIAGFFFLLMPQEIGFLTDPSTAATGTGSYLTAIGFFILMSRGLTFFFLSFFGLWRLFVKNRGFFTINLMLFLIPLSVFVLPTSIHWDWRLFYFMPFLALMSVLMSYLFEGCFEGKTE